MRVDLQELQPNPLRDFTVDPINRDIVETLRQSIAEDGFWGGIICRHVEHGTIQIAAGHHRVHAALAAGITHADVCVREDMDDAAMVRVYARENATQRGQTGTAQAGMIASAIQLLAKAILTGRLSTIVQTSAKAAETLRGQLITERGLGEPILMQFLQGIPGISQRTVREHLANLKASGDYARLLRAVEADLAREQASREAVEAAQAVADMAAQQERTFDFEGVAQHLRHSRQIAVFRETVTGQGMQPYIPVTAQAALAQQLVKDWGADVSGADIRAQLVNDVMMTKFQTRQRTRQEEEHLREESLVRQVRDLEQKLMSHLYGLSSAGVLLARLYAEWPRGLRFPRLEGFSQALMTAKRAIDRLVAIMDPAAAEEPPDQRQKTAMFILAETAADAADVEPRAEPGRPADG